MTTDELTDNSGKRYFNDSLRSYNSVKKQFNVHVIGHVEIKKKADAGNTEQYVKVLLKEFNVDMDTDIVASTHDAAPVMVKYDDNISAKSHLCHNHGLHSTIIDSFYKIHDQIQPDLDDNGEGANSIDDGDESFIGWEDFSELNQEKITVDLNNEVGPILKKKIEKLSLSYENHQPKTTNSNKM